MIKHGPVKETYGKGSSKPSAHSHLKPIHQFITKGIADSKQKIILQPMACDVKGAKRHNSQQCVIAKALQRTMKPQAVAVGRSLAYVVVDGLAIRFSMPAASRKLVEEFDQRGRASIAPVELLPISKSQRLGKRGPAVHTETTAKRKRTKKIGVCVAGGGISR